MTASDAGSEPVTEAAPAAGARPALPAPGLASSLRGLGRSLRFILEHPLARRHPVRALARWLRWQVGSRLVGAPVAMPLIEDVRLLAGVGRWGATANLYVGLCEYEEMAFLLHFLRPGDVFADVGANVGVYSLLAAGAVGAEVVAVEPVPANFRALRDNLQLNRLTELVTAHNIGLAEAPGELSFRLDRGNSRIIAGDGGDHGRGGGPEQLLPVETLDRLLQDGPEPALLKIDVEGFELAVLRGGSKVLAQPGLQAVIVETNGHGAGHGVRDADVLDLLVGYGFAPVDYLVSRRQLRPAAGPGRPNTILVRSPEEVRARLAGAGVFQLGTGDTLS